MQQEIAVRGVPVLIYQMGKVGSDSIFGSLQQTQLNGSIHHLHVLSPNLIKLSAERIASKNLRYPEQLGHSEAVRKFIDSRDHPEINVITSVREPLSHLISTMFQNLPHLHPHLIDDQGNWKTDKIKACLQQEIEEYDESNQWNCNWFDRDFKPALAIDIYEHPFDQQTGSTTISVANIRVLVLRLENSDNWSEKVSGFLQLEPGFTINNRNSAADKQYYAVYQTVRQSLKFSNKTLDRIYGTKYCRHFYSPAMITTFKERWSIAKQAA